MSYNMIDFTVYDKVDCSIEGHWHKKFSQYQKYMICNIMFSNSNTFEIDLDLIHEEYEANNPKYAEIVIQKNCKIQYNKLYASDNEYDKLFKGFDSILSPYYVVEFIDDEIFLTAKEKGAIPNLRIPKIKINNMSGVHFEIVETQKGQDTHIWVPKEKQNLVHIPITTQGKNYEVPKVGDRVYLIDNLEKRSRTHTRTITNVDDYAYCTCDILTLDLPIDRLDADNQRTNGLGLQQPKQNTNNFTGRFEKTSMFKRKDNFKEILDSRANPTNNCHLPINNHWNTQELTKKVINKFIKNTENPNLSSHKFEYFGGFFHWTDFKEELQPIYDELGEYLCEHLAVLTSNKNRPDYLIHIDYDHTKPELPVPAALTWPVLNCTEDTLTVFYDAYYNGKKIYEYGEQDVVIENTDIELVEIDRCRLSTDKWNSIILKNSDWHTVYNNAEAEETRILLQWRFKPELSWEEIKKLTEYIWIKYL